MAKRGDLNRLVWCPLTMAKALKCCSGVSETRPNSAYLPVLGIPDFCIVTKDSDFKDLSDRYGPPPKAVLIRLGNGPVRDIEALLRERYADLLALDRDESRGLLELP